MHLADTAVFTKKIVTSGQFWIFGGVKVGLSIFSGILFDILQLCGRERILQPFVFPAAAACHFPNQHPHPHCDDDHDDDDDGEDDDYDDDDGDGDGDDDAPQPKSSSSCQFQAKFGLRPYNA